ncbi:hypothetical protein F5Y17DRAFT_465730 [Xylariaceae sp. FL0594]|nr:hypothetical protein F5Y17DRAFT_465730 [Xylariaceae sp. FL0594]
MTSASLNIRSRSRTQSLSSDRPSTVAIYNLMSPPLSVSPEAAYIATSAASHIIAFEDNALAGTWYDQMGIEPSGESALVSPGALRLANSFVDQLLFNVLATAKSTALPSLRSAVTEVLKPKLAKDVISAADEELREYLGGEEMESIARSGATETSSDWDNELVWKWTRLRCMVYSSLGDMEEEDEDYYMDQGHLNGETGDALNELVSPAVAIFLTSMIEFIAEHVLAVAGQAASSRLRAKYEKQLKEGTRLPGDVLERVLVEELDMERVALDRTLGRLWRAWKKRIRSPTSGGTAGPSSTAVSHQRHRSSTTDVSKAQSSSGPDAADVQSSQPHSVQDDTQEVPELAESKNVEVDPATVPLPESDDEHDPDSDSDSDERRTRPRSWFVQARQSDGNLLSPPTLVKRSSSLTSRKRRWRVSTATPQEEAPTTTEVLDPSETRAEVEPLGNADDKQGKGEEIEATPVVKAGATAPSVSSQTDIDEDDSDAMEDYDGDSEIEEFTEEPEILTSSRISVGGRSSPSASESGRPASVIHTRSNSVRSVRVIEVQAPRSRPTSIDIDSLSPTLRSFSASREGSAARTPPIVEENDGNATATMLTATTKATTATTTAAVSGPVSQSPEGFRAGNTGNTTLSPPPRNRSPPKPIAATTVTIVSTNNMPEEERHDIYQRPMNGMRNPPMPTLPERSASRPIYVPPSPVLRTSPESPNPLRAGYPDSPSSSRFKAVRTSEDSNLNSPADVARNFEQLIQSNETLQYTLTPENMRDIDVSAAYPVSPTSQRGGSPDSGRRGEGTIVEEEEEEAEEPNSHSSSMPRSPSTTKTTGLGSHPPSEMTTSGKYNSINATSKAPPPLTARSRTGPAPQARDARIPRESLQDFADFIRSTGPPAETMSPLNKTYTGSSNMTNGTRRAAAAPGSIKTTNSSMEARRGPKLQARDAVVNTSNESSELIDFIRRGPPAVGGTDHRIPRIVAPFRNTQDSDYMTSAVGGKAVDAIIPEVRTSLASTNVTESSAPSSMNSQSALLSKTNRRQPHVANHFDQDEMMPKRTQRRLRDPYAIDLSDDDDEEDYGTTPKPRPKQEESLIDFLNSYRPPPEAVAQPIAVPKKKLSTPNLIARLRSGPSAGLNGSGHIRKGSSVSDGRGSVNSRSVPRVTHTPIVIPAMAGMYGPSTPTSDLPRAASFRRVPPKKFEPREAVANRSQTADLASFLRDSAPPPSFTATVFSAPVEDRPASGFSRIFDRRKKSAAY